MHEGPPFCTLMQTAPCTFKLFRGIFLLQKEMQTAWVIPRLTSFSGILEMGPRRAFWLLKGQEGPIAVALALF